jgi:hypothetical protein
MHLALIICIVLAIVSIIISIVVAFKNDLETAMMTFLLLGVVIVGLIGFLMVCALPAWTTTYTKIPADKVEVNIYQNNGIVAIAYEGTLYWSKDISFLNAVKNIDYYTLEKSYNAYNIYIKKNVYPVEKGKIDDYIKEK